MLRKMVFLLLGLLCLTPFTANAQESEPPPSNAWRATYWNNPSQAGFWRATQIESEDLDRDWGDGAPLDSLNSNYWSAQWERTVQLTTGTYRFTATADNGVRVWVDDTLVVDAWGSQWNQSSGLFFGDIVVDAGSHVLRVDYYDAAGPASLQVAWDLYVGPPVSVEGWMAEYFNNTTLSGDPVLYRDEADISLVLQAQSPQTGVVLADNFSVRWSRTLDLPAGIYEFSMRVDDGGRLFVDGEILLDGWRDQGPTTYTARIEHPDGPLDVVMEYYERTGYVVAELTWARIDDLPSAALPQAPTATVAADDIDDQTPTEAAIIVDNTGEAFVSGGAQERWRISTSGYGDGFLSAANLLSGQTDYVWARWQPTLQPGRYEVFVFVPRAERATREARYWIVANGRYTLRLIDQAAGGGRWVPLGIYTFAGSGSEYVTLANISGEEADSTRVLWDALRWEPR